MVNKYINLLWTCCLKINPRIIRLARIRILRMMRKGHKGGGPGIAETTMMMNMMMR